MHFGVPGNDLAPMKNCPVGGGGARLVKLAHWVFAGLPVCRQDSLILILQLPFSNFFVVVFMCHCNVMNIEQIAPYLYLLGTKQTVPEKAA